MANSLFLVGEIGGNDYCYTLLQGRAVEEVKAFVPDVISAISSAITVCATNSIKLHSKI